MSALEKSRKFHETGVVQHQIDEVQAVLAEQAAADRAVADVRTVLAHGQSEDAARFAGEALAQHGGGDRGDDLTRLKQQADAVLSATAADTDARIAKLKAEAKAALNDKNLRVASVALEQALALALTRAWP